MADARNFYCRRDQSAGRPCGDIFLDSAAMGVNFIEREGISYELPRGSPWLEPRSEEGDAAQLIDRFGWRGVVGRTVRRRTK